MDSPAQRLDTWRQHKHGGMKWTEFARQTKIAYTTLKSALSSGTLSASVISKLRAHYPDLNMDWLQYGEGEMLVGARELTRLPDNDRPPIIGDPRYLQVSHISLTPEQISALLIENATLRARAEAAEREAAKYWAVVERQAGKKIEGNRPAATDFDMISTERNPIGWWPAASKQEPKSTCVMRQLIPVSDTVPVTPTYAMGL